MSETFDQFEDIEAKSDDGLVMVALEWMGEGNSGDYDSGDPKDNPLLRFTIYRKYEEGDDIPEGFVDGDAYEHGDWMAVTDSSYCTGLSATDNRDVLIDAARELLAQVETDVRGYSRSKRYWERLSWISTSPEGNVNL